MGIEALSPTNDKRIALVYMVIVLILIFGLEAWTYEPVAGSSASMGGGGQQLENLPEEEIVWSDPEPIHSASGTTAEDETSTESFSLDDPIIKEVLVVLTLDEEERSTNPDDTFKLTLLFEGEEIDSAQGTNTLTVSTPDTPTFVLNGSYSIEITAVNCIGVGGADRLDNDNGWHLSVEAIIGSVPAE